MKGMELSRGYFEEYGKPMIDTQLAQYKQYLAAGLVGEGSECMGFDDVFSADHDFGPAFCIWMPEQIYARAGAEIQRAYDSLPAFYQGYARITSAQGGGRVGALSLEGFYSRFTGLSRAPKDNMEWFRIPERFLATVTNGEVFADYLGTFTQIRSVLKTFYPEDVLKKKLAARCAVMAQAGQYNYGRCMKRGDSQAAYLACSEFVKTAMSAIYLLNEAYMPYYKWIFRGAENFRILKTAAELLAELTHITDQPENSGRKEQLIEQICISVGCELNRRGFTRSTEAFLQVQGEELMRGIRDARLKNLHIMADYD